MRGKLCTTNNLDIYFFFLLVLFIFWLKEMNHMQHMLLRKRRYWFAAANFSFCFLLLLSIKLKAVALRYFWYYNIISGKYSWALIYLTVDIEPSCLIAELWKKICILKNLTAPCLRDSMNKGFSCCYYYLIVILRFYFWEKKDWNDARNLFPRFVIDINLVCFNNLIFSSLSYRLRYTCLPLQYDLFDWKTWFISK